MFSYSIRNTRLKDCQSISRLICVIAGVHPQELHTGCMSAEHIAQQVRRFPEGQFVAMDGEKVIGFAITLRTHKSPYHSPLPWIEAIGGLNMSAHQTKGQWLYGVDFAVDPNYRRQGIGSRLYKARFDLIKRLKLQGFYAGGMLVGYKKYAHQMSLDEYAYQVKKGDIIDPTVSMQMKHGFKALSPIHNYAGNTPSNANHAMLITWHNPQTGML